MGLVLCLFMSKVNAEFGHCGRYTEHEFDEALIQTLRDTCLKYIETEHELGLKEIANLIRNAVRLLYVSANLFFGGWRTLHCLGYDLQHGVLAHRCSNNHLPVGRIADTAPVA